MKITQLKSFTATTALVASVFLGAAAPTAAEERFTLAHALPTEHIFHPTSEKFMEALGEGYEVEYHPGGDLGDWTSLFEQTI